MKRAWRIFKRVLIVVAAVIVLLIAALWAFLQTNFAHDRARGILVGQLKERLNLDLAIGEFDIDLFPPGLAVEDVVLRGSDGQPLLEVDRLEARLDGGALIEGDIVVRLIQIERPRVRLVVEDNRIANLPELPESDEPDEPDEPDQGEGTSFTLELVELLGGEVEVEIRDALGGALRLGLSQIEAEVTSAEEAGYDIFLDVGHGSIAQEELRFAVRQIAARVRYGSDQVLVRRVLLEIDDLRVEVPRAEIGLKDPYDVWAAASVELPLEMVNRLPFGAPTLGGRVRLDAAFEQRAGQMRAQGWLALRDGSIVVVGGPEAQALAGEGEAPAGEVRAGEPAAAGEVPEEGAPPPVLALGHLDLPIVFDNGRLSTNGALLDLPGRRSGRVALREVDLAVTDSRLPLRGSVWIDDVVAEPILAGLGVTSPQIRGELDGVLDVMGTLAPLDLQVETSKVKLTGIQVASGGDRLVGLDRLDFRGDLEVETTETRLGRGALIVGRNARVGTVHVSGTIPHGATSPVRARVTTGEGGLNLEGLGEIAGQELTGRAELRADVGGTFSELAVDAQVEATNAGNAQIQIDRVAGGIRMRGQVIDVTSLDVAEGQSRIAVRRGRVRLGPGGMTVEAAASLDPVVLSDAVALAGLEEGIPSRLRGTVEGDVELAYRARGSRIRASFDGDVTDLGLGRADVGDGEIDAVYDNGEVTIDQVVLRQGGGGSLSVSGRIDPDREMDLRAEIDQYRVPPLGELVGALEGFEVTVSAEVAVRGTPSAPRPEGRLELTDTRYRGRSYGDTELTFETVGGDLHLRGQIAGDLLRLDEVEVGLVDPWPARVRGELGPVVVEEAAPEGILPEGLHARVGASFSLEGNLTELPSLRGQVTVDPLEVRFQGVEVRPDAPLMVRFDRGALELAPATLRAGADIADPGGEVRIEHLHLRLEAPWSMMVRGDIEVTDVMALAGEARIPEGLEATLSGQFALGGDLAALSSLRGRLTLNRLRASQNDVIAEIARPMTLLYIRERLKINQSEVALQMMGRPQQRGLLLSGMVSPEAMDLSIRGDLSLVFLSALVGPITESDGTLSIECRVTGTFDEPHLAGRAELEEVRVAMDSLPRPIEHLNGVIRFSERAILLEGFRANVLGGDLEASGRVVLAGLGLDNYRMDVVLRGGTYPIGSQSTVIFNADLAVTSPTGEETLPLASGTVELEQLRYRERIDLEIDVAGFLDRGGRTEVATIDEPSIRFDISVTEGGPIEIDNNVADIRAHIDEAGGPLRVVGNDQAIGLLGTVRIEPGGTVTYRNTEFEVERALLTFNRQSEIDATLNVIAETTIRDWHINLQAMGTLQDPRVRLSSTPPLNEADIILLLAVGMTQAEFQQAGGATAVAMDVLIGGLDEEIAQSIPFFDEFRITTEYSSRTNQAEPQVRVGRSIGEDLHFGASAGLTQNRDFRADLEYEITNNLSLEATYSNDPSSSFGDIGADMTFHIEF